MKKVITLLTLALMFVVTISKAQTIPNANFENWTSMGSYNNPDSWSCLNGMTASMSTYTCMKGTPGAVGSAYIKLVSKTITGLGVVPGIAVCGTINQSTMQAQSGFAFNMRPANLTGSWQHMIYGSSPGYVDVQLTRWDAGTNMRKVVASAHKNLSDMAMSWAIFTIPLVYVDGNNPDSCIITLAASGTTPTANDYLYIDNLAFAGSVTGISETVLGNDISFYPNPASENIVIDLSSLSDKSVYINIFDLQGKQLMEMKKVNVSSNYKLDISSLPKGVYLLNVVTGEGTFSKKIIKE